MSSAAARAGRAAPAQLLGSSAVAAAWQRKSSKNDRAVTRIKPKAKKDARTCSENSCKSTQLCKNTLQLTEWNRKSPNHPPGFIYKGFKVFKGTNSTSVGAEFLLCLAAIILSSSPSRAHFARNEVMNSAATLHHTQHKVQHQIYIRNAALDWQEKCFQHSAAVWCQSHSADGAQVAEIGIFSVQDHKPTGAWASPPWPLIAKFSSETLWRDHHWCSTQTAEAEGQNSCPKESTYSMELISARLSYLTNTFSLWQQQQRKLRKKGFSL